MKRIKIVCALFLSFMILGSAYVYGENIVKTIQVAYRNITIQVNGKVVPSEQEPFIYQGRTFVPLRTIGEAVNKTVEWDNAKNQIIISDPVSNVVRLNSYYELLNYFPDHYTYTKTDEKLTQDELTDLEELLRKIGKDYLKLDRNYSGKSYRIKNNQEEMTVFLLNVGSCIRYSDGILYYMTHRVDPMQCGSTDGWLGSEEISFNGQSREFDYYYMNYITNINYSIFKDTPNKTKRITDLFTIPLWIYRLEK